MTPIFLSHGSPMIALEPGAAGDFMRRLGGAVDSRFGRPKAIVVVSAHTAASAPVVLGAARHAAVHDFGNFDPELFTLRYDAAGDPALARRVGAALGDAGIATAVLEQGGLDHGIWTALRYFAPGADIPVVPVALVPDAPPAAQFALGEALAPFADEGVLVLGTGSMTHNLRLAFSAMGRATVDRPEAPESAAFRAWFAERSRAPDWAALFDYRRRAPHAALMHPSDEHLLPWFVAAGAGGREAAPERLHASVTFGSLGMDAYAFGPQAASLAASLADAELVSSAES